MPVEIFYEAEFWVGVAFLIFISLLWRLGAHHSLLASLDARSSKVHDDLTEARRLKSEAQKLLAQYQKKQREAETEAAAIIAQAKAEAREIAAEAKARMEEFIARRGKMAETKIAQAEQQAVADVRAAAADAAIKASEKILSDTVKGKTADDLIASAIRDVKAHLD
ncbi:MAG TPA: ATP F0F1 synthase subunit B [Xanthobacteraceae bacterium]|nr:ATP F0F1 synthase subunit B [Xanthobacteraceae bacterium]